MNGVPPGVDAAAELGRPRVGEGRRVGDPRDVVRHGERLLFAHLREQTNSGIDRPLRAVDRVR